LFRNLVATGMVLPSLRMRSKSTDRPESERWKADRSTPLATEACTLMRLLSRTGGCQQKTSSANKMALAVAFTTRWKALRTAVFKPPPAPSASGDLLGLLLENGAEVNRADKHGQTPLYIACTKGHVDAARLLLDKGAAVDRAKEDGATWRDDIKADVTEECRTKGDVKHVYVDGSDPRGLVHVLFADSSSANAAALALHGRWFGGRAITCAHTDPAAYNYQSLP